MLLKGWDNYFPSVRKPKKIDYLCIAGSAEGGTTTFIAFNRKSSNPLFAVKIYRDSTDSNFRVHESEILSKLKQNKTFISESIPTIILEQNFLGHNILIQTIIDGKPMDVSMSSNGIPRVNHAKTDFKLSRVVLEDLYINTLNNSSSMILNQKNANLDKISIFKNTFDLSLEEKKGLKIITKNIGLISKYGGCVQHGDFCRQNILIKSSEKNNKINIIDWSDSVLDGAPLHDLFYFLTSYFMQQRTDGGAKSITNAFLDTYFNSSSYYDLVKYTIFSFCNKSSIDKSHLPTLFGLFLIKQSLFEYNKMKKCLTNDTLPRFILKLAHDNEANIGEAARQQLWITFFKLSVKKNIFRKDVFLK